MADNLPNTVPSPIGSFLITQKFQFKSHYSQDTYVLKNKELKNHPVGIFDSGVGGLSVLREIRRELPSEDLIYVADSGYAPYGNRSASFIEQRATAIAKFLLGSNVKAIVVACNTVTVVAITRLRSWCPVPIVAIEPAIKPAATATKSGVIGVLATTQTIASTSVSRLCAMYADKIKVLLQPCPGLVEQVERAELATLSTRSLLSGYISPLLEMGADTIVLGCTHYPFLGQIIQEVAGSEISIIDPAAPVARELARQLYNRKICAPLDHFGSEKFFASGAVSHAQMVTSTLWGQEVIVSCLPE
ncbi:MAG: glutamate racemase [Desulfamplus sp.]|nr:glutamate racemase [Desulfamplus sp.]